MCTGTHSWGLSRHVNAAQLTAWTFCGWLLVAFGLFEVFLGLLAELTGFGDRRFFTVRPLCTLPCCTLCVLRLGLCFSPDVPKRTRCMRYTKLAGVPCIYGLNVCSLFPSVHAE